MDFRIEKRHGPHNPSRITAAPTAVNGSFVADLGGYYHRGVYEEIELTKLPEDVRSQAEEGDLSVLHGLVEYDPVRPDLFWFTGAEGLVNVKARGSHNSTSVIVGVVQEVAPYTRDAVPAPMPSTT